MTRRRRSRPTRRTLKLAFIAGGTDLIGLMKDARSSRASDGYQRLPDMARIEALPDGGLRTARWPG